MMSDESVSRDSPGREIDSGMTASGRQLQPPDEKSLPVHAAVQHFQGPVLPPQVLKGYEEALLGAAERVFAMAERQASHRKRIESRGQMFGFAIAATTIVGSFALIAVNKSLLGVAAVIAAVVGLSGLFVWSKTKGSEPAPSKEDPGAAGTLARRNGD